MSEYSIVKLQVPRTATLLKRDSSTGVFENTLLYRASPMATSGSFGFPGCNSIKKETSVKTFFFELYKIFKSTSFFDRAHPDDDRTPQNTSVSCVYL